MNKTIFLSVEEILLLHQRTIKAHGGIIGIRDMGLLESAVLRCQSGYYNSLTEQAASLMQSLCMNHCFTDGNKRVSLLATVVFLKMNGQNLVCKQSDVAKFIINEVIIGQADVNKIAKWIHSNLTQSNE